ncbi:MAG: SRPBCC family protein [Beijerinckiaceae bacterium]|nr:SRPBCC family protein [Beijerinckiaceae bacterium]MCZ8300339.1 SRPBCC family protein [Beijerinckiaceae bacterium]
MTKHAILDDYGTLTEAATLTIRRRLPGPVERVWDYLTRSEFRKQWLAGGEMDLKVDGTFEFIWRNAELSDPPGQRPEGASEEHRMTGTITELAAPYRLAISWGSTGGVVFDLEPQGDGVLLTLTHHRVPDRSMLLNVSAGWHAHLDALVLRLNGRKVSSFWDRWSHLKAEYDLRLPA